MTAANRQARLGVPAGGPNAGRVIGRAPGIYIVRLNSGEELATNAPALQLALEAAAEGDAGLARLLKEGEMLFDRAAVGRDGCPELTFAGLPAGAVSTARNTREARRADLAAQRRELLRTLPLGKPLPGRVVELLPYGCVVALLDGQVRGLLHEREMLDDERARLCAPAAPTSAGIATRLEESRALGTAIRVVAHSVDPEAGRILVSTKRARQRDLLAMASHGNTKLKARIVEVRGDGVYIDVSDCGRAYVPASEITWRRERPRPGQIYKKGDVVEVCLTSTTTSPTPNGQTLPTFSIKRAHGDDPWGSTSELSRATPGTPFEGLIITVESFGLFIETPWGVDALIHRSVLPVGYEVAPEYTAGSAVACLIDRIDHTQRRLSACPRS